MSVKKYSFETMPTNYIVGQLGLMANFGPISNGSLCTLPRALGDEFAKGDY